MSENIVMCEIAHFLTLVCTIFTHSVRNFHLLTKYRIIDEKFVHSPENYA